MESIFYAARLREKGGKMYPCSFVLKDGKIGRNSLIAKHFASKDDAKSNCPEGFVPLERKIIDSIDAETGEPCRHLEQMVCLS